MKKKIINSVLYYLPIIFVLLFIIMVVIDFIGYNMFMSAPFYVNVLIRGIEFLLPAIVLFIIGRIYKKKTLKKEEK